MQFVYAQLYPSPQFAELLLGSSTANCKDGNSESCPIFCAIT
jgi:hypothetical protein